MYVDSYQTLFMFIMYIIDVQTMFPIKFFNLSTGRMMKMLIFIKKTDL